MVMARKPCPSNDRGGFPRRATLGFHPNITPGQVEDLQSLDPDFYGRHAACLLLSALLTNKQPKPNRKVQIPVCVPLVERLE